MFGAVVAESFLNRTKSSLADLKKRLPGTVEHLEQLIDSLEITVEGLAPTSYWPRHDNTLVPRTATLTVLIVYVALATAGLPFHTRPASTVHEGSAYVRPGPV